MVENNIRSRSKRHRKKHKNNRNLMIFLALAFLFFTILLSLIVLNKNAEPTTEPNKVAEEQSETENNKDETDKSNTTTENKDKVEKEETEKEKDSNDKDKEADENEEASNVTITEVNPDEIEDSNVLKAYVGDWSPIGTSQEGTHTTSYQNGSQDRIEIKRAVSNVTKLAEDNMVEWRVENGGDQKVIATVSDNNETEYYRVYLTWVDNQGWQVNRLEELKQNDKK